jgi:hypothetical protein
MSPLASQPTNLHPTNRTNVQASSKLSRKINTAPVHNRIFAVMMHTTRYAFKSKARLALDCDVAPSTICRLILGQCSPSFALTSVVTRALEQQLKKTIDPRELVSLDGTYPTPSVCQLCGCKGCLPDEAYDGNNRLKPEYKDVQPGQWVTLSAAGIEQILREDASHQDATQRDAVDKKEVQ